MNSRSSLMFFRQCSECDQASSDEADIAMETLPDGTKRSRRQIKGPIKFIPQDMSPEPKKLQLRGTVGIGGFRIFTYLLIIIHTHIYVLMKVTK